MDPFTVGLMESGALRETPGDLLWFQDQGIGYLPVASPFDYDADYIEKYVRYERDGAAIQLNLARAGLVRRYVGKDVVVDVGIGCGTFIGVRGGVMRDPLAGAHDAAPTLGYDVCDIGRQWLMERGLFLDLGVERCQHATFWDSLEHATDVSVYLNAVVRYVFISMPIFRDVHHILTSKHYKPNEHVYYFTPRGLQRLMNHYGFQLVEENRLEEAFGRIDIGTFVFSRNGGAGPVASSTSGGRDVAGGGER